MIVILSNVWGREYFSINLQRVKPETEPHTGTALFGVVSLFAFQCLSPIQTVFFKEHLNTSSAQHSRHPAERHVFNSAVLPQVAIVTVQYKANCTEFQ